MKYIHYCLSLSLYPLKQSILGATDNSIYEIFFIKCFFTVSVFASEGICTSKYDIRPNVILV